MAPKQVTKFIPGVGQVTTFDEVETVEEAKTRNAATQSMQYTSSSEFGDGITPVQEKAMPGSKTTMGTLQPTDSTYAETLDEQGYPEQDALAEGDEEYAETLNPQTGEHSSVQETLTDEHESDCMCPACCANNPVKAVKKKLSAVMGKSRVDAAVEESSDEEEQEEAETKSGTTTISVGDYVYLPSVDARAQIVRLTPVVHKSASGETESVDVTVMGGGCVRTVDIDEVMPILD